MPPTKPKAVRASDMFPSPEEVWGVYLGQAREPPRPAGWPAHPFDLDPAGDQPRIWAVNRRDRPFRCRWHSRCDCVPSGDAGGADWIALEFCDRCVQCETCIEFREQFRASFLADAIEELRQIELDWRRLWRRYLWIRSPGAGGSIRPGDWNRQLELIDPWLEGLLPSRPMVSGIQSHVVWKSRQVGGSEVIAAFVAFMHAMFRPMAVVRCFSRDKPEAIKWLSAIQDFMWAELPDWMRPPRNWGARGKRNETAMHLGWIERMRVRGQKSVIESHGGIGRGGAATLLIFDEASTMKQYFERRRAAGPATSQTGGKTITISTPEPPGTPAAAEFRRLCMEMGGAEEMQHRLEELKEQTGEDKPEIPPGMFDVWDHAPGWSGHYVTWRQFPFGTEDYYEVQRRELGDKAPIEFSWEPMQIFGMEALDGAPAVEGSLLDEQDRLNSEEGVEPLEVGGLVPERHAARLCGAEFVRGGLAFVSRERIMQSGLAARLCGMPDIEQENRDRFELERMRLEMYEDLSDVRLWKLPEPGEAFYLIADPSDGGFDGDRAAITAWSVDRQLTLASWQGRLYQEAIGDLVVSFCRWLNAGHRQLTEAVIDTTKVQAAAAAGRVVERSGERVFYRKNRGVSGKRGGERRSSLGFLVTLDTKKECVDALNELLLGGRTRIFCPDTIEQLRRLRWKTVTRNGQHRRVIVTEGETHDERADDLADTVLVAAAMQLNEASYRMGVKPGESLRSAAERDRKSQDRRRIRGRQSPVQQGRIRVV